MSAPDSNSHPKTDHSAKTKRGGLLRATFVFGGMTQISRILGLLRDIVFAYVFKVGGVTDAFFVAFKIPNFFRRLFAEGAFSQAFVPVFTEYKEKRTFNELQHLIARTSGTLSIVLLVMTAIGVVFAPVFMYVFGYGFVRQYPETYGLATDLLRITFPYLFFISLTAMAGSVLNSFGRFAVPAITPALLNICLIGTALWLSPQFERPVEALAWGVFLAGLAQLLFQLPFIFKLGLLRWPKWGGQDAGVRRIIKLMIPALFGSAVVQVNLLLDTLIASLLMAGSVSWLYYSDRLVEFPLGVFGVAVGTVILPTLSQKHAQSNPDGFAKTLDWALRLVVIIGLPAMTGLMLLSAPMLTTLFQYGEFTPFDTQMASYSLMAYSLGLPAFILIKTLAPAFYAKQDTRTPVRIGIIAMVVNMLMNGAFVGAFLFTNTPAAHTGLALATAGSAWVQVFMLFWALKQRGIYRAQAGWGLTWLKTLLACIAMGVGLWFAMQQPWMQWSDWNALYRAGALGGLVLAGGAVYAVALLLMGMRPRQLLDRS